MQKRKYVIQTMGIGVFSQRLFPPPGGNPFSFLIVSQVIPHLFDQIAGGAIFDEMISRLEEQVLTVLNLICYQKTPAPQGFKDPHVYILSYTPVKDNLRDAVDYRHIFEIEISREKVKFFLQKRYEFGPLFKDLLSCPEESLIPEPAEISHKRNIQDLGQGMLAVDLRIESQGAPAGGNARPPHFFRTRALGAEDEVEIPGPVQATFGFYVRIDGPKDGGVKVGPEGIGPSVVDVHKKVVLRRANLRHLFGFKMGDFVLLAESPEAIDPDGVRPFRFAEDDGNFHFL
jgi:hypothetical protein